MKTLSTLLQEFDGRKKDQKQLEVDFKEIAKAVLYGGHFHIENKDDSFDLRIAEIEFYFHSENPLESQIFNTAMYHRGKDILYFPVGSLHPHDSGVDVTFERENSYRASFLVRQYEYLAGDKWIIEKRPTYFREDLFGYTGCICNDGPKISWVDDTIEDEKTIILTPGAERINMTANNRPWRFGRVTKRI